MFRKSLSDNNFDTDWAKKYPEDQCTLLEKSGLHANSMVDIISWSLHYNL